MKLTDIRAMVTGSTPGDWEVIPTIGAGTGPSYLHWLGQWSGADGNWVSVDGPHTLGIYRDDVTLRMAWGIYQDDDLPRSLTFAWQSLFPDTTVRRSFVDVFWAGSLVDRVTVFSADGGRVLLPSGRRLNPAAGLDDPDRDRFLVNDWDYGVTQLISQLDNMDDFEEAFSRVGHQRSAESPTP